MTVRKTSAVPLPMGTCDELSEHVLTAGHPAKISVTGLGKTPLEGVTVTSYFPDDPATMVAGPEPVSEKLKLPAWMVNVIAVLAVREPEVPTTVIV